MKFKPTWSLSGEVVTSTCGKPVEIELDAGITLRDVLKNIAAQIDICECQLRFVSEFGEVRRGVSEFSASLWFKDMQAGKLKLHRIAISRSTVDLAQAYKELEHYYTVDHVCLKCMREAGFRARDFIEEKYLLSAGEFKTAGYTLSELIRCFPANDHPLRAHPHPTMFTLFDCQLKYAGYDAKDFKDAGYLASDLSVHACNYCEHPDGLGPDDLDWIDVGAYFTASELASAGYSARELLAACFCDSEILSAGCSSEELANARQPKQRRLV